jgi:hypothetical protein
MSSYFLFRTSSKEYVEKLNFRIFYSKKDLRFNHAFRGLLEYLNIKYDDYLLQKEKIEKDIKLLIVKRYISAIDSKLSPMIRYALDKGKALFNKMREIFDHSFFLTFDDDQISELYAYIDILTEKIFGADYLDSVDKYHIIYEIHDMVGKSKEILIDGLFNLLNDPRSCLDEKLMDEIFFHCVSILKTNDINEKDKKYIFGAIKKNIAFKKDRMMTLFLSYYRKTDQKDVIDIFYQHLAHIVSNIDQFVVLMNNDLKMTEKSLKSMIINAIKLHTKKFPKKSKFMIHKLFLITYKNISAFSNASFFKNLIRFYLRRFKNWTGIIRLFNHQNDAYLNRIVLSLIFQEIVDLTPADKFYLSQSFKGSKENMVKRNMYKLSS